MADVAAVARGIDNAILGAGAIDATIERHAVSDGQQNASLSARAVNSTYDSVYAVVARRSLRQAQFLDECEAAAKATLAVATGLERYCRARGWDPREVDVESILTPRGQIVTTISRMT